MTGSICGADCAKCNMNHMCGGCSETCGKPFGERCVLAECAAKGGDLMDCRFRLMDEINALNIPGMPEVTALYALRGAFINLEYTLPNGAKQKMWHDDRIYLGSQLEKEGSDRCFGIAADEDYLMVSEYGCNGSDPEIIIFRKKENSK